MPQKINMIISNNNSNNMIQRQINNASLASAPPVKSVPIPTSLNAPIISRIHSVKPGCGSCGRH